MGEDAASILQQRPQVFQTRLQRPDKIDIEKSQNALPGKAGQRLVEIAHVELAGIDLAMP